MFLANLFVFSALSLFDPWLTPPDPCIIFDPSMHYALVNGSSYQIWWPSGIPRQFDLWLILADPCMTFDPTNAIHSGQGFFPPNLVAIGHSWTIWPLVDPGWPLHDLRPQQCITLWSGVLPTKFGNHRAFLRQIDLWMTFDLCSGHLENMLLSLGGPAPIPMPSFSPTPGSTTKRIAGHTHTHTHTYRLHYFSSTRAPMGIISSITK